MDSIQIEMIDTLIAEKISDLITELSDISFGDIEKDNDRYGEALHQVNFYHGLRNEWLNIMR